MSPSQLEDYYDAVIVGAGAAGLSATLGLLRRWRNSSPEDAAMPKILVISKLQALRSHTGSAEGGIAASLGNIDKDDWHWHYYDTIKGGDWLVDQDAAHLLAELAPQTVIRLEHDGVAFSRTPDGHIAQRRFGGHTADFGKAPVKRAAFAADRIGHQILHSLWQQCVACDVTFAEEWYVSDLILSESDAGKRANGVLAIDTHTGTVHAVNASNVVIATGGAGRLFSTTSNSWDLTGDGLSLALDAGLQIEDAEFIQFHPTGLAHTGILLSEAARAEGGVLRNADGEAFMQRYAPEHTDLAARDVVSRAIRSEVKAGRGVADPKEPDGPRDCVWLDMRSIDPDHLETSLPQVCEIIRGYANLDPSHDLIPVKPTAHYTMGGIPVNTDGQVYSWSDGERHLIRGLYAAGECSCVSVHGANRLGGNSLLDACLFGTRAGESIARDLLVRKDNTRNPDGQDSQQTPDAPAIDVERRKAKIEQLLHRPADDDDAAGPASQDGGLGSAVGGAEARQGVSDNAYALMSDLGRLLERHIAVVCDRQGIAEAKDALDHDFTRRAAALRTHSDAAAYNQELTAILEAHRLLALAKAVVNAMSAREESRGSLKRLDFPERDDERFLAHSMTDTTGRISWQPVHIVDVPPRQREY
ncbi:MAG: FAD-binding protein [Bifidobacterium psychraerophilum]|uniref:FAD-binding protein n=1 Tax=Bifidobacterium psychraerophilum TaxID=218140 RepID=UPI0039EA5305